MVGAFAGGYSLQQREFQSLFSNCDVLAYKRDSHALNVAVQEVSFFDENFLSRFGLLLEFGMPAGTLSRA